MILTDSIYPNILTLKKSFGSGFDALLMFFRSLPLK